MKEFVEDIGIVAKGTGLSLVMVAMVLAVVFAITGIVKFFSG